MAEEPVQPQPTSKGINWKTILIGAVVGGLVVGIGALGFYLYQGQSEETTSTKVTTPKTATDSAKQATPSAEKDETADWETFESSKYKYSIKYPPTWVVTNNNEESFVVRVAQGSFERVIIQVNVNTGFCEGGTAKTKTIQVSGNEGTEYSCFVSGRSDPAEINYLFKDINGNQNYVISGEIFAPGEELTNQLDTIKLILSTFKFLD